MCKICDKCKSVMNYDPYFEAEVCVNCGKIERKERKKTVTENYKSSTMDTVGNILGIGVARV